MHGFGHSCFGKGLAQQHTNACGHAAAGTMREPGASIRLVHGLLLRSFMCALPCTMQLGCSLFQDLGIELYTGDYSRWGTFDFGLGNQHDATDACLPACMSDASRAGWE